MKINPQHKVFDTYYDTLKGMSEMRVKNEASIRLAFEGVLNTLAPAAGWRLVPEQALPNGRRPDGTLRDGFFARGYWEAKDSKDDLETEIRRKIAAGYPTNNIIFEDTRQAVLYQDGLEVDRCEMARRERLAALLERFFNYAEPPIVEFHKAVEEFKERIPDLAERLLEHIRAERRSNRPFMAAFQAFHDLCKAALNPQISAQAIEEMLVQHLLTERLFRKVFDNPDFVRRNVIAAEIEKVIDALTGQAFNRDEFLRHLDGFYRAIEDAARDIRDWTEKQAFMNTVYERFFQGFSVKQADTYGIVYTPQEIVDFMVASVETVLQQEFGRSLSSEGVQILDPCTGTGSFIVNILRRITGSALERKYRQELFANEIMLLPYYIAALNIEHTYYDLTRRYLPFEGICFVDTLDMVLEGRPQSLWLSEANTERITRENQSEITVIIGNPPYNVGQVNENDNNKNRRYEEVDKRVRETYAAASKATLNTKLYDAYVKFFRWATDRLGERDGIVCFVSNNSFVHKLAFDGMRQHLARDFTSIYHLDLGGDARERGGGNVFGIMVGVGITVLVRHRTNAEAPRQQATILYYKVPEAQKGAEKLTFLTEKQSIAGIDWQELQPDSKHAWLTEGLHPEFADFLPMGTKEAKVLSRAETQTIFKTYSLGVSTNRDSIVYDFDRQTLATRVEQFIKDYNAEVFHWVDAGRPQDVDNFVRYDKVKWSRNLKRDLRNERYAKFDANAIRRSLYRPFTSMWLYHADIVVDERGTTGTFFPTPASEAENIAIVVSDHGYRSPFSTLATNVIPDLHLLASTDGFQCFPFYTYAEDGSSRRENITDWALGQFQQQYGAGVSKWDIFHYVYALLHHPTYRARYAENLKRDLPRIPLAPDARDFRAFVQAGEQLKALHLGYEQVEEYPLRHAETPGEPFTWRVKKMRLAPDKQSIQVNDALRLEGIPPECFGYRLGNRSALEWVIDQYQVSTDPRSGITSDPNREDEPEYIVRLLKRVITVSLRTVEIVGKLPALALPEEALDAPA